MFRPLGHEAASTGRYAPRQHHGRGVARAGLQQCMPPPSPPSQIILSAVEPCTRLPEGRRLDAEPALQSRLRPHAMARRLSRHHWPHCQRHRRALCRPLELHQARQIQATRRVPVATAIVCAPRYPWGRQEPLPGRWVRDAPAARHRRGGSVRGRDV